MYSKVAFFRGINVGGKNSLPMKELQALMSTLGATDIHTVIQSGNVLFNYKSDHSNLRCRICDRVFEQFHFKPEVIIFSLDQFKRIIDATPFTVEDGKLLHYFMMQETPADPNLQLLENVKTKTEEYRLIDNALYLFAPDGIARSKLMTKVEKAMGVPVTARNQNTIRKLIAKI